MVEWQHHARSFPALERSRWLGALFLMVFVPSAATLVWLVVAMDLATGSERRIVMNPMPKDGATGIPSLALSPDGRRLAVNMLNPESRRLRLFTVAVDGSDYRELYAPDSPEDLTGLGPLVCSRGAGMDAPSFSGDMRTSRASAIRGKRRTRIGD
jgi:hypothetical protein